MMNPILSTRFRDLIQQHFGGALFFHAPLDEQAGQQTSRDLVATKQGTYSGAVFLDADKIFPGLDAGSFKLDGIAGLLRSVGASGDFRYITETANWQIHVFMQTDEKRTQAFLCTEAISDAQNISDGFVFYELLASPTFDGSVRYIFVRQGLTNPAATSPNGVARPGRPTLYSLARSDGTISLYVNSVFVPWATDTIGTLSRVATQSYPLSVGCTPAGAENRINGKMQDVLFLRGARLQPQSDVDFIYRAAVRGMTLWDYVSQTYPSCDVFCEFDEAAGGTTLVNRAGADGEYIGGVTINHARLFQRSGLTAKFVAECEGLFPSRIDYVHTTGVFTVAFGGRIEPHDLGAEQYFALFKTANDANQKGFKVLIREDGNVLFQISDESGTFLVEQIVNVGNITEQTFFVALVGNGTQCTVYRDGVSKGQFAISTVAGASTQTLDICDDASMSAGLAFAIPETLPAYEIAHIHKLLQLNGPLAEILITEPAIPVLPTNFILSENGSQILSENGELILFD